MVRLLSGLLKKSGVTLARPIFIWGVGKCGSHLLYDILSLHPSLICCTVPARWNKGLWGSSSWGDATPARLRGAPIPCEGGARFWSDTGVPTTRVVGVWTRDMLYQDALPLVRRRYMDLAHRWAWDCRRPRRILDKTIAYILMLDLLEAGFPDSVHIFCLRDPRSILNSMLRICRFPERPDTPHSGRESIDAMGFWPVVPPGYDAHRDEPLVPRLSWQIRALYEIGLSSRAFFRHRLIEFRHEWLFQDAHQRILELLSRLGLPSWQPLTELVPDKLPDFSPPWPEPGHPLRDPYSTTRCYRDDELPALSNMESLAVELGYAPHRPGGLTRT